MLTMKKSQKEYIDRSFYSLGTVNHIRIYGCEDEELIDAAVKRVLEIDDFMSAFKPYSYVSRLNYNSGREYVNINTDTLTLLNRSVEFSRMSRGAFDITIRPLIELWGIGKKQNYIPCEQELKSIMKLINYNDLLIDNENCHAALRCPGQAIDLGGIAKGYAADEVKRILISCNVKSALINLGGNILTIGGRPDGKPWQIGVQNPLAVTGQFAGILSIKDKTVVTSGSNEKFFIKDNVRYHHILDPRTGKPANTSYLSVTAVCDSSTDADALTTSLFILGPQLGQAMLKKLNAEAIFITENLDVIVTDGLRENFRF
ncbi:MAG TPA: FAD:protein FMN transferase [Clostridia bacterium]